MRDPRPLLRLPPSTPRLCAAACGVLAAALMATPPPALAAPNGPPKPPSTTAAPTEVNASEAFDVARRLWESGDFATALPLFERALQSSGSPNARLYVARCLRDLGRLPEAYEQMSRTVADAMELAEQEDRYAATRNTAAAELALLEPRVARVVVALDETLTPATVTLGGTTIASDRLGQPVAVMPGAVEIVATPASGAPIRRQLDAKAGAVMTVSLSATPDSAPSPASPKPAVATEPDDDETGFGVVQGLGIGVTLLGVAGLVVFGVERAAADAEIETLEQECGAGPCTDRAYGDVVDRGKTAETIASVGLAVGIAGILAGTAMLVFGGEGASETQSAWEPTPSGLRLRF